MVSEFTRNATNTFGRIGKATEQVLSNISRARGHCNRTGKGQRSADHCTQTWEITAKAGGDLNIISVPDTGSSSNKSASGGISLGGALGGLPSVSGVQVGGGTGSGDTNWISEQSGLISKGGMDVDVAGNTNLEAGKIISQSGGSVAVHRHADPQGFRGTETNMRGSMPISASI